MEVYMTEEEFYKAVVDQMHELNHHLEYIEAHLEELADLSESVANLSACASVIKNDGGAVGMLRVCNIG